LPASITAFVFGIMGLNFEKTTHVPGAKAHAITAIVLGSVLGLIHLAVLVLFIGVMVADY
jgi:Mg2+ and Co2+ transporter CorA